MTDEQSKSNLEWVDQLLDKVRYTDFNDISYQSSLEDLLVAIVTHLKGEEIK